MRQAQDNQRVFNTVLAQLNQLPLCEIDIGTADLGWTRLNTALNNGWLTGLCEQFVQSYPGLDQRGQGAFVIARLSYLFTTLLAGCDLLGEQVPILNATNIWVRDDSETLKMRIEPPQFIEASDDSIRNIIVELMSPFIEPVKDLTRLSKTPQWRLVADSIASSWLMTGRQFSKEETGKSRALAIIHQRASVLTNRFTGYVDVEVCVPGKSPAKSICRQAYRSRGGCCRVFTSDTHDYCATCIHLTPDERQRRLSNHLQQQLALTI